MDEKGRWVENGRMKGSQEDSTVRRIITTRTFINNIRYPQNYPEGHLKKRGPDLARPRPLS